MNLIVNKATFDIEDFEEEIVLVQIQTGVYYTIKGSGPVILRLFQDGLESEILLNYVADGFGSEKQKETEAFVAQLINEGILTYTDASSADESVLTDLKISEPLLIEKFDDVSDLIKLDPIHDVSDLGWPHKK